MTPNPLVISGGADMADAGYIMLRNRISGLPVIDADDRITGIVTKTDIIRALASHA
jgi:IMP dehydrogenase